MYYKMFFGATNGTKSLIKSFTDTLDPFGCTVEAAKLMKSEEQKLEQTRAILIKGNKDKKISDEELNAEMAKAEEQTRRI